MSLEEFGHLLSHAKLGEYERRVKEAASSGDRKREADARNMFAKQLLDANEYAWAGQEAQKAIIIYRSLGDEMHVAILEQALAYAPLLKLGRWPDVISLMTRYAEVFHKLGATPQKAGCYSALGYAYDRLGDYQKCLFAYAQAMELYRIAARSAPPDDPNDWESAAKEAELQIGRLAGRSGTPSGPAVNKTGCLIGLFLNIVNYMFH